MKIRTEEEKRQYEEVEKVHKVILSDKEYGCWKNLWLDALGWSHKFPHTTNLHKIILRGNYKWYSLTDVELEIELERSDDHDNDKGKIEFPKESKIESNE